MVPSLYRCFASSRRRGLPCEFRLWDSGLQLDSGNILFGGQAELEHRLLAAACIAGVVGVALFLHARPFEFLRFQTSGPLILSGLDRKMFYERRIVLQMFSTVYVRGCRRIVEVLWLGDWYEAVLILRGSGQ